MAIPKGTLMAIFWTTVSYLVLSATIGECSGLRPREAGWWAAGEAPVLGGDAGAKRAHSCAPQVPACFGTPRAA